MRVDTLNARVAQRSGADPTATGRENLILQGRLYGLRGGAARARAAELLDHFGLTEATGRLVKTYSGGMQHRLDVALGLMHRPAVLFLDEPTTGLDPESRAAMWQEIARLAGGEGMTVLLTTHYLEEADRLASQLAIVDRGRVVATGTPDQLKGQLRGDAVHVELPAEAGAGQVRSVLAGLPEVRDVVIAGRNVSARSDDGAAAVPVVLGALQRAGIYAASVAVARPSLDDVYLRHTGRRYTSPRPRTVRTSGNWWREPGPLVLADLPEVRDVVIAGRNVSARSDDGAAAVPVVLGALQRAGINASSVAVARPSLDDVYLRHTGRRYSESETSDGHERARTGGGEQVMATAQLESVPSGTAIPAAPANTVPFGTTLVHTWYLTGRKLHALVRQPWVLAFSVVQPVIWLFLFGQLFRRVIDIPGFAFGGTYLDYLVPGLIAMNAMSNNMWAGMSMIEEIDRGTLNRFLAAPASRVGIMNATVVEQAVSTTVQSLIIVGLGLAGGARYHGGTGGVAVMVAASILVGVVFGALSNATGMLLRSREAIIGIYTFFMLPLMFLSSAFIPTQLMPGWMQAIASRNPLNWAVQIGRSAVSAHPDWSAIAVRCGGLLILAVVCVAVSVVTFRSYQKNV